MHGLALVTQRLLRVAFGVTHGLGALSPGITIGMQTDTDNPEALALIPEPRRPGRRSKLGPVWKQRAALRQSLQNRRDLLVKAEDGRRAGLAPVIAYEQILPVHILGLERNQVDLRRAHVPGQFKERLAFRVNLRSDDCLMFLPGNAALLAVV